MAENWIQGAIKKPGALHKELGVPEGKKIPGKKLAKAANAGGCCQPDFSRIGRIASFCANTPWCHSLGPKQSPMPTEGAGGETGSGCFRTVQHGGYTCGGLLQPVVGEVGIALGHGNVLVPENSALESLVLL